MEPPVTLVLASRNPGKTAEIKALLEGYPVNIKNLDDFGPIPDIEEDGDTFEANAYKKASLTARFLGQAALADDSGLAVDALDGAPGVHSARWAGDQASDADRCNKLLAQMKGKTDRRAAFHCVISIAVPTGAALTYEASCSGQILEAPRGENGFGYDPVFYYPDLGKSFAELSRAEKGKVSHRGKALREMSDEFDKVLVWLNRHLPSFAKSGCMADKGRAD